MRQNEKQTSKLRKKSGFTLIEIILVVVIIGILAGIGVQRMGGKSEMAMKVQAKGNIHMLSQGVQQYEMMNGTYPPSLEGLLDESKGGPYLEKKVIPQDPWGKSYSYSAPGSHNSHTFDLSTTAPDGEVINNWE